MHVNQHTVLLGLAVMLVAAVLLFHDVAAYSMWVDEVRLVRATEEFDLFEDVYNPDFLDDSVHPPVLYIALGFWMNLAGQSDLSLSMLTAFATIIATALTFRAGADLTRSAFGGFSAALIFVSFGFVIYYGQQVHNYGLFMMFSAALILVYLRWLSGRSRRLLIAIIILNALILYTHYYGLFVVLAINVHALHLLWESRRDYIRWFTGQVISAVLYLPWLPALYLLRTGIHFDERSGGGVTNVVQTTWRGLLDIIDNLLFGQTLPYAFVIGIGIIMLVLAWFNREHRFARALTFLIVFGVSLSGFALVSNHLVATLFDRRLLPLLIPVSIYAALVLARFPRVIGVLLLALLAIVNFNGERPSHLFGAWGFRPATERLVEHVQPDDVVLYLVNDYWHSPYNLPYLYYAERLLPEEAAVVSLGKRNPSSQHFKHFLESKVLGRKRFWVVGPMMDSPAPPTSTSLDWVQHVGPNAFQRSETRTYGFTRMVLYEAVETQPIMVTDAAVSQATDHQFGGLYRLDGYRISQDTLSPGGTLRVQLALTAHQSTDNRYHIALHLQHTDGTIVSQWDGSPRYRQQEIDTRAWVAGRQITGEYTIDVPEDAPAGSYTLRLYIYHLSTMQRLPVNGDDGLSLADNRLSVEGD